MTVVIPCYNEGANLPELLRRIRSVMPEVRVVVVDDASPDGTAQVARRLGCDVLERRGKRGLASAIMDGIDYAESPYVVVMDGDLQHPPEALPRMFEALRHNDVVVGSRYCPGGSTVGWPAWRRFASRVANVFAWPLFPSLRDCGSGYFGLRRAAVPPVHSMRCGGWKVLQEILLKGEVHRVVEVPIAFAARSAGQSKFSVRQVAAYFAGLLHLYNWRLRRITKFGLAEGAGGIVGFALVAVGVESLGLHYMISLSVATAVGFLIKYGINVVWTFASERCPEDAEYDWLSFYRGNPIQKWWKRKIAQTVWQFIPDSERLLDVGCGSSPIITHYRTAVGVDVNGNKLAYLRQQVDGCVTLQQMSAEALRFADGEFADVICVEMLEHLERPGRALQEIARVTRPAGRIVIAVPDSSKWLWHLAERFTPYQADHKQQFSLPRLRAMAENVGLRFVAHKYVGGCDCVALFTRS